MSHHEPVQQTIAGLPDDRPDAELSRRVGAAALRAFEAEAGRFARFDRWMLGRIAPAVLSLCVLASAFDLVRYFVRVFGPAPADAQPARRARGQDPDLGFFRRVAQTLEDHRAARRSEDLGNQLGAAAPRPSAEPARVCGRTAIIGCPPSPRAEDEADVSAPRPLATQARPPRTPPS